MLTDWPQPTGEPDLISLRDSRQCSSSILYKTHLQRRCSGSWFWVSKVMHPISRSAPNLKQWSIRHTRLDKSGPTKRDKPRVRQLSQYCVLSPCRKLASLFTYVLTVFISRTALAAHLRPLFNTARLQRPQLMRVSHVCSERLRKCRTLKAGIGLGLRTAEAYIQSASPRWWMLMIARSTLAWAVLSDRSGVLLLNSERVTLYSETKLRRG